MVVVNWAVLADDGHPSLGEIAFAVGTTAALPRVTARQEQQTPWMQWAAAWLFFVGLALALGGLLSERLLWRGRDAAGAPVGIGLFVAANGALTYLVALAADRVGGLAYLASPADVALALETRPGRLTLLLLVLVGVAAAAVVLRRGRAFAIVPLAVAAVVTAARGHSGSSGLWWAVPADALHLAAAAAWVGALVHLARVVYAARRVAMGETLRHGLRRYAAFALVAVLVSAAAGLVTALAQFGSLDELLETGYGRTLLVKGGLIGVALLVALAARTRALCLPWPERGLLRRAGGFELGGGAVILALLALLVGASAVQLVSSVVFAVALVATGVAGRRALSVSADRVGPFVVAGLSALVAVNAGLVAAAAALFRDGPEAGGDALLATRLALAAGAIGLTVAATIRSLSRGGSVRLPLLRRLTTAESVTLIGALGAAALLVNVAPPRAAVAPTDVASLGPPPLTGPALRLADFTGQIAVGLTATARELRFEVVAPNEGARDARLTAEAEPPGKLSADLYPRRCGDGCFTIRYRLPRGSTAITAEVEVPGLEGGRARFVVPWPPRRAQPELLRRVARTMLAVRELEMTELVVSGASSSRTPGRYRLSGKELLSKAEMYRGGAVDVRVLDTDGPLTELAFALPASSIWYRMWIDETYRVRREVIINRGHLITRTFRYASR